MAGYKNLIYTNAEELMNQQSRFMEYENAIHITATNSLKASMVISNNNINRWFTGPIISFAELLSFLGDGWAKSKTNLKQFTLLSKALRIQSEAVTNGNRELFAAIDKNQELILKTIRMLSESGYTSSIVRNRLANLTEQERIFLDLWETIEPDYTFQCIHNWFERLQQSPKKVFRKTLVELFESLIKDTEKRIAANILPNESVKDIVHERIRQGKKSILVLHGFYFLVPIQKRLFDVLSERFEIVHVINYQPNYKHGFQTVEHFLNLKPYNYTTALQSPFTVNYHAKEFLLAINGQFIADEMIDAASQLEKINYFEFSTLQQLRRYTQIHDERYVSPRAMEVTDFLATLEQANNKKLSEHPLGVFLVNIHRINKRKFDVAKGQFLDNENVTHTLLRELFNSGYLYVKGVNAKSAMRTLDMLKEITKSFTMFEEWYECLRRIVEHKQEAENAFKNAYSYDSKDHLMYSFFHETIGYFYCTEEELNFVREAIEQIRQLFETLFNGNEININQYVEILEDHIENEIMPVLTSQLDKEIAQHIIMALTGLKSDTLDKIDRQDLMQGLQYFLGQNQNQDDEYEIELYGQQEQNSANTINSLLNSDGLQFDDNRVIHFTMMDHEAFPTKQALNIWPLSKDAFEQLCEKNKYLNQLKMRKELEVEIACYQFYLIMTNAVKINFSIVKRLNEHKNLKRCFYLNFFSLIRGSQKHMNLLLEKKIAPDYMLETVEFGAQKYDILPRQMFNRCPKRFVYTFLLDWRPVFYEAFHEPFLFQQLIGYDYGVLRKKGNFAMYRSWFPHWSETKKNIYEAAAIDYVDNNPERNRPHFTWVDRKKYTNIRMGLSLFGSRSKDELIDRGENPLEISELAKNGDHCKYCSFQMICKESSLYKT
ncbi:hypothetical protein G159_19430 [Planococcus glaciei CHR43]|uniref:hypothetical protein n=1 Tax=Planococcus glaciei TaxID=459472 RepID=UPI0003DF19B6|nr:hypothetical protein [Planococcus glaciei]ETP67318.1 hypothetical protein G159_19430 [Planococcus glaciei CHR43]